MKDSIIKVGKKIVILILWFFIWELSSNFLNKPLLLPSPINVFTKLLELLVQQNFWKSVLLTMVRVLLALVLSIFGGIVIGIVAGFYKTLGEFLEPFMIAVKSTPAISIIIIALVWFKSGNVAIFTAVLICLPIIYTNVTEGIKCVDIALIKMAKLYKVKWIYKIKDIYLPSIKSYITSGILMCVGIGWKVVVASEVLSTPKYSIGLNLLNTKTILETEELFAWTTVVVIFSLMFEQIFKLYTRNRAYKIKDKKYKQWMKHKIKIYKS